MARRDIADPALVSGLKAGDASAWNDAFALMYPIMVRTGRGIGLKANVIDDAVQDTWVNVFRHIHAFEERSSLRTWITRIFVRQCFQLLRKDGRYVSASVDESPDPVFPDSTFDASGHWTQRPVAWPETSALRIAQNHQAMAALQSALDTLPEQQRLVFTLRDIDGLDGPEVAELAGVSEGNQRVLLHRARHKLRDALVAFYGGAG